MATRDPRIDAYIAKAPVWAQPILRELRERVHAVCPAVTETLKWRTPSFEHDGLLGGMAAFKSYCSFGFWKETLLRADQATAAVLDACGRMTSAEDLPSKSGFARALRRAAALNAAGVKVPRAKSAPKPPIATHPDFARALAASKRAAAQFTAFPPSAQREYLEWIADAKKDDTRQRRVEQAVAWIAAGKRRNWKYEAC
jgi:uncharacterized protein YdeI (YjbR/CyaY-like superfamily)